MFTSRSLPAGLGALSLSLSLLAGCAAPLTPPAATAPAGTPAAAAPASPVATPAAPAAPAPEAAEATAFSGQATFQGAPLAGYSVMAFRGRNNQPAPVSLGRHVAAAAEEVALAAEVAPTDAEGRFSLRLVGLAPGQVVRLVLTKGDVVLETLILGNGKALGGQSGQVPVNALTTAQARLAQGVLATGQLLTPAAAAPVDDQLLAELDGLAPTLTAALTPGSGLAQGLVTKDSDASARSVDALVQQAGLRQSLTQRIAAFVADIVKRSAEPGNAAPLGDGALASVRFPGTVLSGAYGSGGFSLTNTATGQTMAANSADLGKLTERVTRSSHGSSASTPTTSKAAVELSEEDDPLAPFDDETSLTLSATQLAISGESVYTIQIVKLDGTPQTPELDLEMTYDENAGTLSARVPYSYQNKVFYFDAQHRLIRVSNFYTDGDSIEQWYVDPEVGASQAPPVPNPEVSFPETTRYHYLDGYTGTNELFFDENGLVGGIFPDQANDPDNTVYYVVKRTALPE